MLICRSVLFLWVLLTSYACLADDLKTKQINIVAEFATEPRYFISFCVSKSAFSQYQLTAPILTFGGKSKSDMTVLLAENRSDTDFTVYSISFVETLLTENKNFGFQFHFKPVSSDDEEFTLYYDMKKIISEIDVPEIGDDFRDCLDGKLLEPTRVVGETVFSLGM